MIYQPPLEQSDWSECYNHGRKIDTVYVEILPISPRALIGENLSLIFCPVVKASIEIWQSLPHFFHQIFLQYKVHVAGLGKIFIQQKSRIRIVY